MAKSDLCLVCNKKFFGRSGKKYCSTDCRISYHNNLNRDSNVFMRTINSILRKNRRILAKSNPKGKRKIHYNQLVDLGFNFSYYTNKYTTKSGNTYIFCYDQGYIELDNHQYALVVRQSYVN